jgi:hypothetical protein
LQLDQKSSKIAVSGFLAIVLHFQTVWCVVCAAWQLVAASGRLPDGRYAAGELRALRYVPHVFFWISVQFLMFSFGFQGSVMRPTSTWLAGRRYLLNTRLNCDN